MRRSLAERIAIRLQRDHNFDFVFDPCNATLHRDREAIAINTYGAEAYPTWQLGSGFSIIRREGKEIEVEIGSCQPASDLIRMRHWVIEWTGYNQYTIYGSNEL